MSQATSLRIRYNFQHDDGYWLKELYDKRVRQNRDLSILISDSSNERGTGKTVLACKLAEYLDRTKEGLTEDKITHDGQDLQDAYTEMPKGSSLILDEAETSVSKYRAASETNKSIRDLISQARVLEKYLIMSAPASGVIDNDLKSLFDVWIMVERRGRARVHYCNYNPYKQHPLFERKEPIYWEDLDKILWDCEDISAAYNNVKQAYEYLTEDKKDNLHGRNQGEEDNVPDEVQRKARDKLIKQLDNADNMTQREIADATGLSRSRVADIVSD